MSQRSKKLVFLSQNFNKLSAPPVSCPVGPQKSQIVGFDVVEKNINNTDASRMPPDQNIDLVKNSNCQENRHSTAEILDYAFDGTNLIASGLEEENAISQEQENNIDIVKINDFILLDEYDAQNLNILDASFSNVAINDEIVINDLPFNPDENAHDSSATQKMPNKETTKEGKDRKRKTFDIPFLERKKIKIDEKMAKFGVKAPCKCKRKCFEHIAENEMQSTNKQFWSLTWESQRVFVLNRVKKLEVLRKKQHSSRNNTYQYFLHNSIGMDIQVCKVFFLATLGYLPNNDKMLHNALAAANQNENAFLMAQVDMRGRHASSKKLDTVSIKEHIQSFRPSISHYRREHAPNRRYLPSDISGSIMYKDFREKNPTFQCSIDVYRRVLREMNITFTRLGHEECEKFKQHEHNDETMSPECELCQKYIKHKSKYTEARKIYQNDATATREINDVCFSADLQKVIMLPRMEEFKIVLFTPRIIIFNESFVPVGKKPDNKPIATLWHEGIAGRKKEEIVSTFHSFVLLNRDAKFLTLWLDNYCSSQNKNWCLLSFIVYIVNSPTIKCEQITLKIFEPGHTFMSADSFHHQVELSMKNKKICDFEDFKKSVKLANSGNVIVNELKVSDFHYWQDLTSQAKIRKCTPRPYLSDMVQITATRGSYNLKYWTDFNSETFFELDFIKVNSLKNGLNLPLQYTEERGISLKKKEAIIKYLCPLMDINRQCFWKNLKESPNVADLNESFD